MRVAIVHYWICSYRGGEKTLEAIAEIYPSADIFTHVYAPKNLPEGFLRGHKITTSFVNHLPFAKRKHQAYLPLMPRACASFDLRGYDLIISCEAGPAKGIIADPDALHICYCHSPMRYLWDRRFDYAQNASAPAQLAMRLFSHRLRIWDRTSALGVDHFVTNSNFTKKRIQKSYRRDASVIYPPVHIGGATQHHERNGLLFVGALESYKRPDIAIQVAHKLELPLTIIGRGSMERQLKNMAGSNIRFLGHVSDQQLSNHYANAQAMIFPGVEDFGITLIEAQAHHLPVVAFKTGGQAEAICDAQTGLLVETQSSDAFATASVHAINRTWSASAFDRHVASFSKQRFQQELSDLVDNQRASCHAKAA